MKELKKLKFLLEEVLSFKLSSAVILKDFLLTIKI
ncbi:hypothetical protein P254_01050 [Acinetobacter oleivorans CIP 110421]|nr:hypothetical protein P254_01050 [Acinetobacter oleivorans CIP 110421]